MAENKVNAVAKPTAVTVVKGILDQENVKSRFSDVMGAKAPQFMASVVNVVSASASFKDVEPNSIVASAFVAATYDLPIDGNLGFAALVPYSKNQKDENGRWCARKYCQFQMMYKGFIQLAIRTGEYEKMNCSDVYEDELVSYNPITGECSFADDFSKCTQRKNSETDKIVGYYAWFRLRSGFVKELYMSKDHIINHAKKYSMAYRYDIEKGKKSSKWSTDFNAMALKTVIKQLLSKWGILSIQMQNAIIDDQKVYNGNGDGDYSDNKPDVAVAQDPFGPSDAEAEDAEIVEDFDMTM